MTLPDLDAEGVVELLELEAHPEGGYFKELFRAEQLGLERASSALIYFLLAAGQRSHWHRLDCLEVWHLYAGAPLSLFLSPDGQELETHVLGLDVAHGQSPFVIVGAETWMSAVSQGAWTLVGCQTAPAFEYAGLEMAPEGWVPGL